MKPMTFYSIIFKALILKKYSLKIEFKDKKYFDFGTSTEDNGNFLNKGLIFQKEGFGARGIVYKHYIYNIK